MFSDPLKGYYYTHIHIHAFEGYSKSSMPHPERRGLLNIFVVTTD